jgi:hypothetical protein
MGETWARVSQATADVPEYEDPNSGSLPGAYRGISFFVTIVGTDLLTPIQPTSPIIFTIGQGEMLPADRVYLYDTVAKVWRAAACDGTEPTLVDGVLTTQICHLTQFAVFSVDLGGAAPIVNPPQSGSSNTTALLAVSIILPIAIALLVVLIIVTLYRRREEKRKRNFRADEENRSVTLTQPETTMPAYTEAPSVQDLTTKVVPPVVPKAKDLYKDYDSDLSSNATSNTSSSSLTGSSSSSSSSGSSSSSSSSSSTSDDTDNDASDIEDEAERKNVKTAEDESEESEIERVSESKEKKPKEESSDSESDN